MLDLEELKQLVAFADAGTLSKVAEEFHISTPSITRSMKNLEEAFGVSLFTRSKNKISLNATGQIAVEQARKLIMEAEQMVSQVQAFEERQRTIVVKSCAPAPMWELLKKLGIDCPGAMVSSGVFQNEEVLQFLNQGDCDIAILPFPISLPGWDVTQYMKEQLFVCVPKDHEFAKHSALSFSDLNGFNFLLRTELGFWDTLCREKMPSSKFLVQTDAAVFDELVKASALPCFTTDYIGSVQRSYPDRVRIPVTDAEAHVIFYLVVSKKWRQKTWI